MKKNNQKGPSQRQLRVGEQLKHIIAETLKREEFYWPEHIDAPDITVTEVRPSPDLKNATVFVIIPEDNDGEALALLNQEAKIFQKEIARQQAIKFTPRVTFKHDTAFNEANRIEELLRDIKT